MNYLILRLFETERGLTTTVCGTSVGGLFWEDISINHNDHTRFEKTMKFVLNNKEKFLITEKDIDSWMSLDYNMDMLKSKKFKFIPIKLCDFTIKNIQDILTIKDII
jgi:hypothetical protein